MGREGIIDHEEATPLTSYLLLIPWFQSLSMAAAYAPNAGSHMFSISTLNAHLTCVTARRVVLSRFEPRALRHFAAFCPLFIQDS